MNIYIVAKYPRFILPIAKQLEKEGFDIVLSQQFNSFDAKKADIIHSDWLDENAVYIQNFPTKAKKILRIHAYEVYTEILAHIDWKSWHNIIFVSRHIRDFLIRRLNGLPIKSEIIPCGIELEKYKLTETKNNKIGFVGYLSRKKGIGLVEFLANSLPEYEFHLAGKFQELDVQEKLAGNHNLYYHGWIDNISKFFSDKRYVLNTSLRESQSISICEGMACGCQPLIRDWISAKDVYRPEWIYSDFRSLKKLLENRYEPKKYRKFIAANYSFRRYYQEMKRIITDA